MLHHWTAVDRHAAISGIKFQQMRYFAEHFTDHIYTKCLIQGNMTESDAVANAKKCIEILKCDRLLSGTMPAHRVMQIPLGTRYCRVKNFNTTDSNSNVTNYYQSGGTSMKLCALVELMMVRDIFLSFYNSVHPHFRFFTELHVFELRDVLGVSKFTIIL